MVKVNSAEIKAIRDITHDANGSRKLIMAQNLPIGLKRGKQSVSVEQKA